MASGLLALGRHWTSLGAPCTPGDRDPLGSALTSKTEKRASTAARKRNVPRMMSKKRPIIKAAPQADGRPLRLTATRLGWPVLPRPARPPGAGPRENHSPRILERSPRRAAATPAGRIQAARSVLDQPAAKQPILAEFLLMARDCTMTGHKSRLDTPGGST